MIRRNNVLHGINSAARKSFKTIFRRPSTFFFLSIPQMYSDATFAFRFPPVFHELAKTKILSANKSRDVERYVCRTAALLSLLSLSPRGVTFNPSDIAAKFGGMDTFRIYPSSPESSCLPAVGEKFSRVCGEEDFCLDALS